MSAASVPIDADGVWASFERQDAEPLTLRLLAHDEALTVGTPFDALIGVWLERRTGGEPPEWDAFEFADFRGWHSRLIVSAFPDDEPDPVFRIVGEDWKRLHVGDSVGLRFSQRLPRLYALQFRQHFQAIRDTGRIGWASGAAPQIGREFLRFQAIELPYRRAGAIHGMLHGFHLDS